MAANEKSDLVVTYPFISALVIITRLISFYGVRILTGHFLISERKAKIEVLTKKMDYEIKNERNIGDFR